MAEVFSIDFETGDLSIFAKSLYSKPPKQCGYYFIEYDHNDNIVSREIFRGTPKELIKYQMG